MKSQRYDASDARRVHIGLITDSTVAVRVASRWPPEGLFGSRWENHIGGLCVEYARRYGKAPGREIETMFTSTADKLGEEDVRAVERLLGSLSDEYARDGEVPSSDYILDLAGKVFNKTAMRRAVESVQESLNTGRLDDAEAVFSNFKNVDLGPGAIDEPTKDYVVWMDTFESEDNRAMINYPGSLGIFFANELCRDSLVAFLAPEKRGKSFWLMDVAVRGLKQGCRVALFSVGDMSRRQMGRRLGSRLTRLPRKAGEYLVPVSFEKGDAFPKREAKDFDAVGPEVSFTACAKAAGSRGDLRLACYPNSSISVDGLSSVLKDWARDGWVADVVVIDYADILAPPPGVKEYRDQINTTWMHLRRMSQELHCLVLTATQADADSYDRKTMGMGNFSEDKRKYAHVTGVIGINQTPEEKENGVMRLNWIVRREADYSSAHSVRAAGCLALACPAMLSAF